jgi:hypothetical protein
MWLWGKTHRSRQAAGDSSRSSRGGRLLGSDGEKQGRRHQGSQGESRVQE